MAIELTGIDPRTPSRLRLVFSGPLAAGAFGTPAPAAYVVENQDGAGLNPAPVAAIIVAGASSNVELALEFDLVEGALYRVTAIGIPGVDLSTSTALSDQLFRFGVSAKPVGEEPKVSDGDLLLYGRDLVFTGDDFLENAEGDLATVGGVGNAQAAVRRRYLGNPLAWAPTYSPNAREFVDVPLPGVTPLRSKIIEQGLADDRVASVEAELVVPDDGSEPYFEITTAFIGGRHPEPVQVALTLP